MSGSSAVPPKSTPIRRVCSGCCAHTERNQDELLPASTGEYVERVLASLDKPSALIVGRAKSEEGDDLMTRAPPRAGMGETSGG
jgi:hypothetical protein